MALLDDFRIRYDILKIEHFNGTTVYTVNQLYTAVLQALDDFGGMDDLIPISAQTPNEYTLINGWFIDDESCKYLTGGAIQTSGWTHPTNTTGIRVLTLDVAANLTSADIGTVVTDSIDTGKLLAYDTTLKKLWVRCDGADDLFDDNDAAVTVDGQACGNMANAVSVTGETIYSNIFTLGSIFPGTMMDVYQNDAQLTPPWWSSEHIDVLVKVKEAGTEIDSGNLTILARKYSTLYDHYVIDASSGRNPVPLATSSDINNQTASGTVSGYNDITITFGYTSQDIGNGAKPYDVTIDCVNNHTVGEAYEYLKYVTRTGSSDTLNGLNGEYYVAVGDIRLAYTGIANGPFTQTSSITSSSGGTGYIVSVNTAGGILVIRNVHGTFAASDTITSGSTTATISGTPNSISPSKQAPFGTFAGGRFFGARGVFLVNMTDANNYQLIDSTGTADTPPTTATTLITVKDLSTGSVIQNANVLVWVTGSPSANYFYQASVSITGSGTTATVSHSTHGLVSGDYVIIEGVTNDDDYNGVFQVNVTNGNEYTYTTTETLNLSPAAGSTITATFALISDTTDDVNGNVSDTRVLSGGNQSISGWVRKSSGSPYYQQGAISGTVSSTTGFSTTVQLARDE